MKRNIIRTPSKGSVCTWSDFTRLPDLSCIFFTGVMVQLCFPLGHRVTRFNFSFTTNTSRRFGKKLQDNLLHHATPDYPSTGCTACTDSYITGSHWACLFSVPSSSQWVSCLPQKGHAHASRIHQRSLCIWLIDCPFADRVNNDKRRKDPLSSSLPHALQNRRVWTMSPKDTRTRTPRILNCNPKVCPFYANFS